MKKTVRIMLALICMLGLFSCSKSPPPKTTSCTRHSGSERCSACGLDYFDALCSYMKTLRYLPFEYILLLESSKSNELLESMIEGCLKPRLNDPESLVIYEQVMIINPERAERKDWYSSLGTLVVDYGAKNQYGGMTRRIATIKVQLLSDIYQLYIESMDTSSDVFS